MRKAPPKAGGAKPVGSAPVPIYLPIAELPVNIFLILGLGVAIGFISGMFGIGGGFLMTPLLILVGIPPAGGVASVPRPIAGFSFFGPFRLLGNQGLGFWVWVLLFLGWFFGLASCGCVFSLCPSA